MAKPADAKPAQTREPRKVRTRTVVELWVTGFQIQLPRGSVSSIIANSENSKDVKMTADLDARTISIAIEGKGKMIVPFEGCRWKYGAGLPQAD